MAHPISYTGRDLDATLSRQETASLARHFDAFEAVYAERYQARYGFWRPVIRTAVEEFLKCGDLQEGFARVRCSDCGHSLFVAFSCK